jgi:hypothetical protein
MLSLQDGERRRQDDEPARAEVGAERRGGSTGGRVLPDTTRRGRVARVEACATFPPDRFTFVNPWLDAISASAAMS